MARAALSIHRRRAVRCSPRGRPSRTAASIRRRAASMSGISIPVMGLAHLQRAGHRPDRARWRRHGHDRRSERPSGRATRSTRWRSSRRTCACIRHQLERFLDFSGPRGALMRNNAEWLMRLGAIEFMRDVGQALHGELHDREGLREVAARRRDLVHRVLVHAASGVRLPRAAQARGRATADRRQRSVGEHHGGRRADSAHGRGRRRMR